MEALQQKLTSFAVLEGGWITWLFLGLATGGAALFIDHAIYLLRHRGTRP
jgi:hypothetical protein